jgi:NADPH:quinone reductase-like Zn-dependent oxidoreductase
VEKPSPKSNEVCIKIHATTVTGSDVIVRSSKVAKRLWLPMRIVIGFTRPRNPILGFVLAGEIASVGKETRRFKEGDRVFGSTMKPNVRVSGSLYDQYIGAVVKQNVVSLFGTYAEYKCLPEDSLLALKPPSASFEEAAAIPYGGGIALHFLKKAHITGGQKVLIIGASGAIGSAALQLARQHYGAEVTGVCSTRNLELVKSMGADAVIDYTREDYAKRGDLYDLVLDAVPAGMANRRRLREQSQGVLTPHGRHLSIDDGRPEYYAEDLELLRDLVEAGKMEPVIDRCYPLEKIAEAHRYVETGHKRGNVIITVSQATG